MPCFMMRSEKGAVSWGRTIHFFQELGIAFMILLCVPVPACLLAVVMLPNMPVMRESDITDVFQVAISAVVEDRQWLPNLKLYCKLDDDGIFKPEVRSDLPR